MNDSAPHSDSPAARRGGKETSPSPALPADDRELLGRYAAARDHEAFAELVRRHIGLVYGAALRQLHGAVHRAEEVTQSVFTDLAHKAASLSHRTELAGWLYTSTHFAAAKLKRGEQRRQQREQEAHTMQELLSGPAPEIDWDRLRPVLDDAMHELGERERDAILQRFFQGRRFAEMAGQLGLSEDAARMRVERALDKLRSALARREITSTSAALAVALANQPAVAMTPGLAASVTSAVLASATAASGPVATVLQFMATSKIMMGAAGIAVLAALGTATQESRARQTAADALATATGNVAQLDGRLRDLQSRAAAAEQALQEMQAGLAATEAARPPAPAAAVSDPLQAGRDFLAQHPEARTLWDERERANIAAKLMPIYRMMNLSPAEQEQLETLFLGTQSGTTTLGGPGQAITLRREATVTPLEADARLQALLGAENYKRFAELSRVAPTFDFTVKLASALYRTEPLSPEQAVRVMQIFVNASPMARGGNPNAPATIDWDGIKAEAGSFLSPTQVAALTGVQRNFEYQQAVQKLTRAAMEAASAPKTTTPPSR